VEQGDRGGIARSLVEIVLAQAVDLDVVRLEGEIGQRAKAFSPELYRMSNLC
jgi:hypothetical protein